MSRVDALIGRMTLGEKLGQLTMTASNYATTGPVIVGASIDEVRNGSIGNLLNMVGADHVAEVQRVAVEESRLRIPLLIGFDILHGHRTIFPTPLAEASLFDPRTWAQTAREAALEAAADGLAMTFAPMLDVARDPRWGRIVESPGEDPWVTSRFAEAKVHGFQGNDLAAPGSLAATAKHFCAYGAVTAGREYGSVDVSERSLREIYLPPFAAAVAVRVAAIMPAFIDIAGIPMTANKALLHDWLRVKLGFDGVIVSDYHAIAELVRHGVAEDLAQAAALALQAGVDIDMMGSAYRLGLPVALRRGLVGETQIDQAVRRVLILKERLGLFDDPYRRRAAEQTAEAITARRRFARQVAASAIVMLKNDGAVLPLDPSAVRLAVLGPLADAPKEMPGPWAAAASIDGQITVIDALRELVPASRAGYAAGVDIDGGDLEGLPAALALCSGADVIILCVGEAAAMSGEAASRAHLDLPGRQREFAEAVFQRARASNTPVIVVLFSGRPLTLPWLIDRAQAVLCAWFLGSEAGHAIGDVLFGQASPSGRTPVTWPRSEGQIPLFFSQRPGGRPADPNDRYTSKYLDESTEPLFPFGFGLTYGRFTYANLQVPEGAVTQHDTMLVRVDVRNEGPRAATETVFLFVHRRIAGIVSPLLELKAVAKAALSSNEVRRVTLLLPALELQYLDANLEPRFGSGEVEILVGPCADAKQLLRGTIRLAHHAGR